MICSLFCLLLTITELKPVADETWVYVSPAQLAFVPAQEAVTMTWFGKSYPSLEVKATDNGGWRSRFHVRARAPVAITIDVNYRNPASGGKPPLSVHTPCFTVTRPGETLWHAGTLLAGGREPYLYVLALFAANRELLQNDPQGLRVGDALMCPTEQEFTPFVSMSALERKNTYQRLMRYGERITRR